MKRASELNVVHVATTTRNPLLIKTVRGQILEYSKYYPWYSRVAPVWAHPIPREQMWKFLLNLTETLPIRLG